MHRVGALRTTGELLKWKIIWVLPFIKVNEFAGMLFTVKSPA